jgi:predicted secreted protein
LINALSLCLRSFFSWSCLFFCVWYIVKTAGLPR